MTDLWRFWKLEFFLNDRLSLCALIRSYRRPSSRQGHFDPADGGVLFLQQKGNNVSSIGFFSGIYLWFVGVLMQQVNVRDLISNLVGGPNGTL
ncbi:MAG: hypothetical protein COC12_06460 [Rhodobacteraceae bacterium]|nr:MAG: hypothetical protein COC12_06460 [Paracoccaceae bacterium]